MKKFFLLMLFLFSGSAALVSSLPSSVSVDFPMDRQDQMNELFQDQQITGELNRFSFNNVSAFASTPGWSIWFSEESILENAQNRGFFCIVEYKSLLGNSWKRSVVTGRCGHRRLYKECTECQSVSRP